MAGSNTSARSKRRGGGGQDGELDRAGLGDVAGPAGFAGQTRLREDRAEGGEGATYLLRAKRKHTTSVECIQKAINHLEFELDKIKNEETDI